MKRFFEAVPGYEDKIQQLPQRGTSGSAGYDFYPIEHVTIQPGETVKLETGIRAYMQQNEWLDVRVRSSYGIKGLRIKNVLPVIDSDYYDNPKTLGHIMIFVVNESNTVFDIKKEEPFAQGIFTNYLTTDDDFPKSDKRVGGFGSTSTQPVTVTETKFKIGDKVVAIENECYCRIKGKTGVIRSINHHDVADSCVIVATVVFDDWNGGWNDYSAPNSQNNNLYVPLSKLRKV